MRKLNLLVISLSLTLILPFCRPSFQPVGVKYADYRIQNGVAPKPEMQQLLQPYADSVNRTMNDVIAVTATALDKKQPEGTLGNLIADAMLFKAREVYKVNVDAAFVNYGGIRLPSIPAGNITRGKIFELSPFDNQIVLITMNGASFQAFLDHVAGRGGWPCAGLQLKLKNKKAVDVLVGGKSLNASANYTIALPDYVANGGDEANMLKSMPQQNNGYLLRDAVISYCSEFQKRGEKIVVNLQNRITNAE
ncbi:MAG: hypothetical protein RLY16_573 [Bacteroidota bacterium]